MIQRMRSLDWRTFLGRPRLPSPPLEALDALYRQSVLVTGAGGTIGSALALRLGNICPSTFLLDTSESRLYDLQQACSAEAVSGAMHPILGDVSHRTLLDEVFSVHAPKLVFHTAAFKHVALGEQQPLAAIANNVFGTLTLTRAASAAGARVILVSSDKAVEPVSVVGAAKRLSELIVLATGGTVLRLGNVLGSRGSVTETFARQLALGRPLTITDPGARRFFITLDEAVNLLLSVAGEPGPALFVPEIASPHFITDLAHFISASLAPGAESALDFTAPRPGEKDPTRFWSPTEGPRPSSQRGLLSLNIPLIDGHALESSLASLRLAVDARDRAAALLHLRDLVPGYHPGALALAAADHPVSS